MLERHDAVQDPIALLATEINDSRHVFALAAELKIWTPIPDLVSGFQIEVKLAVVHLEQSASLV